MTAVGLVAAPIPAGAAPAPTTVVIGVDHLDPANQQPERGRLFEYTDFFSRDLTVAQGETVDFRLAGFHSVALARSEEDALAAYPLAAADEEKGPNGFRKIVLGPSFSPVQGGDLHHPGQGVQTGAQQPTCGLVNQPVCTFTGGSDYESSGPMGPDPGQLLDWNINIQASPGHYTAFCDIHPGMKANVTVVSPSSGGRATSQSTIDKRSAAQFANDQHQALVAEARANHPDVVGEPGHRRFTVKVGLAAANNHVAIDEMLPNTPLDLQPGDRVRYVWEGHNVHSVRFPDDDATDPPDFGFDCSTGFTPPDAGPPCTEVGEPPEFIFDPGNAPSKTVLTTPTTNVDSGVLIGADYGVDHTRDHWSVRTDDSTAPGTYTYHCTIHDFMTGTLNVAAASPPPTP